MVMATVHLLGHTPAPTMEQVREGLGGNLCRCTGYQNIVKAVQYAARKLRGEAVETSHPLMAAETADHH